MASTTRRRRRGRERPAPADNIRALLTALMAIVARSDEPVDTKLAELDRTADLCAKQLLDSPHLSIREAALYLGWSPGTLKRKMARSEVPFHRRPGMSPYFLRTELDEWLADPATLCPATAPAAENQEVVSDNEEANTVNEEEVQELLEGAKSPSSC